jgi:hypothetical protein
MVYCAEDYDKIMENFQMLSSCFAEVAACLCYSNFVVFLKDIRNRVQDLNFSLEEILKKQSHDEAEESFDNAIEEKDPSAIRDQLKEMEDIRVFVEEEMRKPKFSKVSGFQTAQGLKTPPRPVEGSLPNVGYSGSSPHVPRRTLKVDTYRFQRKLRTLENICPLLYVRAMDKLKSLQRNFSQYSFVIAMEEAEKQLLHLSSSLLLIGNAPVMNFARKEDYGSVSEDSELYARFAGESYGTPVGGSSTSCYGSDDEFVILTAKDEAQDKMDDVADTFGEISMEGRGQESSDGGERLSKKIFVVPMETNGGRDDKMSGQPRETPLGSLSVENSSKDSFSSINSEHSDKAEFVGGPTGRLPPFKDSPQHVSAIFDYPSLRSPIAPSMNIPSINSSTPVGVASALSPFDFLEITHEGASEKFHHPLSPRRTPQLFIYQVFPDPAFEKKQGFGVLHFCRYHVAVKDIMFALLQGRHLVISGNSKSNVKRFVQVLRLFVPGGSGAVLPWLEMPSSSVSVLSKQGAPGNMPVLTTHHLLNHKLIGISNRSSLPKQFQSLVSHWDIDTGKLHTPIYSGKLLSAIASRNKNTRKDEDFIARIHCVFLELGMQAYMYYRALMEDRFSRDSDLKYSKHVLKSYTPHDQSIIKYLSEVVVQQQVLEFKVTERSRTVTLGYKQNKRIECKAKPPRD